MARQNRFRDRYPLCHDMGLDFTPLDDDAASVATPWERIRSVWPFMVRRVSAFQATLGPRSRANFDLEDTLAECWIALAQRDHKWDVGRGRYITFAGSVVDHALDSVRDRARTVQSPRNSSSRLKAYRAAEAAGTLTPRLARTAEDIRRAYGEFESADSEHERLAAGDDPAGLAERREADELLRTALAGLDPAEAAVIRHAFGLGGVPAMRIGQIAASLGCSPAAVTQTKARALAKVRERLGSLGHPSATEAA